MATELVFHADMCADGIQWWAEVADIEGLYAVGPSLAEVRELAMDAIRSEFPGREVDVVERLADAVEAQRSDGLRTRSRDLASA